MAIDGRRLVQQPGGPEARKSDPGESPSARVVAVLIVAVPLLIVLVISYVVGTWEFGEWIGAFWGGLAGVVSTLLTVGLIWVWRQRRH